METNSGWQSCSRHPPAEAAPAVVPAAQRLWSPGEGVAGIAIGTSAASVVAASASASASALAVAVASVCYGDGAALLSTVW